MSKDQPKSNWRVTYVDLQSATTESAFVGELIRGVHQLEASASFWKKMGWGLHDIVGRISEVKVGPVEAGLVPPEIGQQWQQVAASVIENLEEPKTSTLLCLDELAIFLNNLQKEENGADRVRRFLQWFRQLRMARHPQDTRIRYCITGSIGLDSVVQRLNMTASINDLDLSYLGPLTSEKADDMLLALGVDEQLELPSDIREHILTRITWPIPYFLQIVFKQLHRNVYQKKQPLSVELVDASIEELVQMRYNSYFEHWHERLDEQFATAAEVDLARNILATAAQCPDGIEASTIKQLRARAASVESVRPIVQTLEHDGYLARDDDRWYFASTLLREWWNRQLDLEDKFL